MVTKGLVVMKTNNDLNAEEAAKDVLNLVTENYVPQIAQHIRRAWETNRDARMKLHDRLLACLRARKGEYSHAELERIISKGGADPVFMKVTGTKSRAAAAWIRDILKPANDKSWSLMPTEEPEIPDTVKTAIAQQAAMQMQEMAQQDNVQLTPEEQAQFKEMIANRVRIETKKVALMAAKRMEQRIVDKQQEGQWGTALEEFIEDFVTFPTAFLKGPYEKKKKVLKWGMDGVPQVTEETSLAWRRVSPFDAFPSPYARSPQEGDFIERIRLQKSQLYGMLDMEGYNNEAIRACINDYESGLMKEWLWDNFEREQLVSDVSFFAETPDTLDAVHYWGSIKASDLLEWGIPPNQLQDLDRYHEVDAILIGKHVIRAVLNADPMGHRPYHHACWDAVPGSMWGIALPEQMEDHQKIVNASTRALLNNMAVAAGPQAVVLSDMMAEGEDITDIFPLKIWQAKSSITGNSGNPVTFFQPEMNAAALLGVIDAFERKADDVTNVPRYSYGNEQVGGAGNTASGLSMLMNSAAKGIRRAIAHIDENVIQPTIFQTFIYEMTNQPEEALKGDCKVVPRGSAAILIKDALYNLRKEFLALTANPTDMELVGLRGRAALLREFAKELGMETELIPSDDEVQRIESSRIPPEIQQMQAELDDAKKKLEMETQKLAQAQLAVEQEKLAVNTEKSQMALKSQAERDDLDADADRQAIEEERLDAYKLQLKAMREQLQALQTKMDASTLQKEAELERRLATMERRVGMANIEAAIATAKVENNGTT